MRDQTSWKNNSEFCANSASVIKFITNAWLTALICNILVELIDGLLMPFAPIGTVLGTMVAS